jgi:hypothetical protein
VGVSGGPGGFLVTFLVMLFGVGVLKVQVGVRVDGEVWRAFKSVCKSEEIREGIVVEGFLNVVLECGSALGVLRMLRRVVRAGVEGFDDYARVLLSWYKGGRRWVYVEGRQISLDGMLLLALRAVSHSPLREEIRGALVERGGEQAGESGDSEESAVKEECVVEEGEVFAEGGLPAASKRIRDIAEEVSGRKLGAEQAEMILKKLRDVREKLKLGRANVADGDG